MMSTMADSPRSRPKLKENTQIHNRARQSKCIEIELVAIKRKYPNTQTHQNAGKQC